VVFAVLLNYGPESQDRALPEDARFDSLSTMKFFARLSGILALVMTGSFLPTHGAQSASGAVGIFDGNSDVGGPRRAGSVEFDPTRKSYVVKGGGSNMWFSSDAFHFVWKKVSGDVSLAADISFSGQGGDPHRKACLIIRQSLAQDSAYADAALHGDGLTSLQYREGEGAPTREIQSNVKAPHQLRLEKRGKYVSMSVAGEGDPLQPAGGSFRLVLEDPFYVGLAVCAHNDSNLETAVFSNVELSVGAAVGARPSFISTLETVAIASKDRRVVWWTTNLIEAPNWSRDGNLYFNSKGRILRIPVAGGEPLMIDTGFATRCNNDHGISPDGRTHAYCAERNGEYDVYTIPASGGEERRLTTAQGLDDGPDYSPDGQFIYFNSDRTGKMHIWRMKPDGSQQEQVTSDEWNNWFPHPSPDGKWIAFLSYEPDVKGHPENKDVMLRLLSLETKRIEVLAKLFGGQGTINVPSWSPDSRSLAFVSYQTFP